MPEKDARCLGISYPQSPVSWLIDGHDPYAPTAIHRHSDAISTILLVGEIYGTEELASKLGLAQDTPVACLAKAALAKFGSDTPAELLGEWSLFNRTVDGKLTLMIGSAMRDRVHYAIMGSRVAVASDLFRLARIGWIGSTVDEAGLLFRLGRGHVRESRGDRTMVANICQLGPGDSVVIDPAGRKTKSCANQLVPQSAWHGTFADAVVQSEDILRNIMRERIASTKRSALLLSGGLDSTLLAWLATMEGCNNNSVFAISSAAPKGSGIDDEMPFARLVADHLGMDCAPAVAADNANFFRPPDVILGGASGPILSNRHCLTEAFQIAAKAGGATRLINGTYGEMTATARLPQTSLARRLRSIGARIYHDIRKTYDGKSDEYPFHVRLAPHRFANLPEPIQPVIMQARKTVRLKPDGSGLLGYLPGAAKSLIHPNEFYPGALRMDFPFRDMRLLRLFAGFPVAMLLKGGDDRPVVRTMLDGHIPDPIRLRRHGMPAEPDRYQRMQRQANAARTRITAFRKADIDEWIDLEWLDAALLRIAAHGAINNDDTNEVQLTSIAAEFLWWWRTRF